MFSPDEQYKLRAACSINKHTGKNNPDLERVIRELMNCVPHKFHTESSLASRCFYHEPKARHVPMALYVISYT